MKSIVSYPERGPYGDAAWRGNTTGHLIKDLFKIHQPKAVIDPMKGSDTTGDVCRELDIPYLGLDLQEGFNILIHPIRRLLQKTGFQQPDFAWVHPPYDRMIVYSGKVWGDAPVAGDLSRCRTPEEFVGKFQKALINVYDALQKRGTLAIQIGDMRKGGHYHSFQADIINMGLGKLNNIIIKAQHNCRSSLKSYTGNFIPITHEYVLVFSKPYDVSLAGLMLARTQKLSREIFGTWRNVVSYALESLGGIARLKDIYEYIGANFTSENRHVEAKIRQTLQKHFRRVDAGRYALN